MKLISWNVNGLRACLNKGFWSSSTSRTRMWSACRRPRPSPTR